MDVKLRTSEMLLKKLAFGCGDAQLQAVAEIRLFAKWDDANRLCLGRAGAVAPLVKLLEGECAETRVQDNAMLALLNMSINAENKVRMVREEGCLEAVMGLANDSGSGGEIRANAAALLYSLVVDDEARRIVGTNESLWSTFLALLRDGAAKCKAEALKALFVGAADNQIREKLLQENLQAISLLISMVTVGKVKLTEDCLAVLALLASCGAGAVAISRASTSITILAYLVNSGSSARVQENAIAVLLNICQNDQEAKHLLPLQTLMPALSSMYRGGSERGKAKAEALLSLLGIEDPASLPRDDPNTNYNYNYNLRASTMPFLPTRPHDLPPHQSNPLPNPPASSSMASFSNASRSKPFSSNKYINLARNLFTHKPRKKNHSTIT